MLITFVCAAVLVGALARGYTGFGASMIWVASLSLVYPPMSVVPTVLALEVLASLALLPSVVRSVQWPSMRWMLISTVATIPLGVALLKALPEREMRTVVAVSVLAATIAVGCGVKGPACPGPRSAVGAGTVSGVMTGSTGIGGPPAVLLYFSSAVPADEGRATLIAYFLATDAVAFVLMGASGVVDSVVLVHTAWLTPVALIGISLGQHLFRRTGGSGLRGAVLALLAGLSVSMLVRVLFFD